MRALLAITWRELRERWTLPLATFCFGFVPLALAIRAGERPLPIAGVLMVPTAWAVAVMMGSSVIARDLGDGRLGFFFARPVPWWAIAGGKLLAALLLTLATGISAGLPSLLFEWNPSVYAASLRSMLTSGGLAMMLALLLGLVGLGHAAGVVYRARSTWAGLDFLLFAAAVSGVVLLFRAFVRLGVVTSATLPGGWSLALGLLLVAVVPLAAAAVQVARGRSDLQGGHRALSAAFWTGALVWFVALGAVLARELGATPAEFASRHVAGASGDGRFLALAAFDRGRAASFILDTTSGGFLRISSFASFTPDGRHAVWEEEGPLWRFRRQELRLARLDGPGPRVETVELDPPLPEEPVRRLALDEAAGRVAVVQAHTLSVLELPSGRALGRTAGADDDWVAAAFLRDGRLRALRRVRPVVGGPGRQVLPGFLELVDFAGGVPSSRLPLEAVGHAMLMSGIAGERILLFEPQVPRVVSLHDARTGRRLRVFAGEPPWRVNDALLLADGSVAVVEMDGTASRLRLATDMRLDRLIELPGPFVIGVLGGELPGGRIAVGLFGAPPGPGARGEERVGETVVIELATGEIVRREAGLLPAAGQASKAAATLFETAAGELVRLDPDTGQRRVVVAAKTAR